MAEPGSLCWLPSGDRGIVVATSPEGVVLLVSFVDHKRLNEFPAPGVHFPYSPPDWHRIEWFRSEQVSFQPPLPSARGLEETRLYEPLDGALRALPYLADEIRDLQDDLWKSKEKVAELRLALACELGDEKAVIQEYKKPWKFFLNCRQWSLAVNTRKGLCRARVYPSDKGWDWELYTEEELLKSGRAKTAHEAINLSMNHLP